MLGQLLGFLSACGGVWPASPAPGPAAAGAEAATEGRDGLLWWRDLARCHAGDLSVAVVQANQVLEDQCRLESSPPLGTVLGVFDGHAGPDAARFACDHLFPNLREAASGPQGVTADAIREAFLATEEGFVALVSRLWETQPDIATVGTCCLVGVMHQRTLFVANLGDSRAVLGKKVVRTGQIAAEQLSCEHNANDEGVRQALMAQHPDDEQIVVLKHGVWRVKGIIQVSRSIGNAYLKHTQYNTERIKPKFRLSEPFSRPILSANPSIISHCLQPSDCFVIFASDGLWEHLSNQEAVEIVHNHQRAGSARRLIKAALHEAARKREMRYSDLTKIDKKLVADRTSAPGTGERKARTVDTDGKEWWHSEAGQKTVKGSAAGGCFQKFSYKVKTASGVVKPGWLMVEYSVDGADLVLCEVYRSPRAPPLSRASSATSAARSESDCKKGKAADHDHPEAPPSVRPQLTNEQLPLQEIEHPLISDDPDFFTDLPEGVPLRAHIFWPEIVFGLSSDDPVPVGVDDADLNEYMRYLFRDLQGVPPCAPNHQSPSRIRSTPGTSSSRRYMLLVTTTR